MPTNQVINFPVLPVKYEYTKFALEKKKKKKMTIREVSVEMSVVH
jgi:hypothetical protein